MGNPSLDPLLKRIKVRALRFYSADEAPAGRHAFRPPFTQERTPDGLGTREFIRVLRLLERCSIRELADAVDYALDIDITDADSVHVILEHRREEPVPLFSLDGRPHLKSINVDTTNVATYGELMECSTAVECSAVAGAREEVNRG